MKTTHGFTIIGSTLLLAAAQGRAQSADKFFFDLNIGAAVPQSSEVHASPFGNSGNVQYDAGVRGGLGLGYHFTPAFAGELETGVLWNSIHSIQGNLLSGANSGADLYQIPLLADFIYTPFHGNFAPYVGVGAGGVMSYFDSSNVPLFGARFTDEDFTFAYQAEAGLTYSINSNVDFGLEYKFLGTTDHHWADRGITFDTSGTMTHAVLATLTWKF